MMRRRMVFARRAWTGALVAGTAACLVVATGGVAFALPTRPHHAPAPPIGRAVPNVTTVKPRFSVPRDAADQPFRATATAWPAAAVATVRLSAPGSGAVTGERSDAPGTPVWARSVAAPADRAYSGPTSVDVRVLDHASATAAGVDGVLLAVSADRTGTAEVGVDYAAFAQAYGGGYAGRLRLVSYPSCVLTTPAVPACHVATPLVSTNDADTASVSARVSVPARPDVAKAPLRSADVPAVDGVQVPGAGLLVLAADSTSSDGDGGGSGGTYAATSLKPSGSWTGGDSSGNFTYSYPLSVAGAPSSLVPDLSLAYDSSSTDGETAATQAQASWVGEGWDTPDSFIEESFQSCSDSPEGSASPKKTGDECYDGPIFTLSLNGSSTSLVWDSTKQVFKAQNDDGSVITHYCTSTADPTCASGTSNGSGTYDNDWFKVTERDGTTYSFGMNHLPGWSSGDTATNSVASEPVYSAHSGDPCYSSSGFDSSVCTMSYRWGLDYVVDTHGNAMAYYYDKDTNYYGEDNGAHNVSYVRDIHLDHIDYGFTDGHAYGTVPDKIVFTTGDRCVSGTCDPLNSTHAPNWPDVPYDLICKSGTTCTAYSPSFFSTVRLTTIAAEQYSTATSSYTTVDSYALTQTMPATGDGTAATLWLSQIVHTGSDLAGGGSTTPISLPPISFAAVQLPNRVDDVTDGLPAFYKYRIATITTESGSQINVTYGLANPCTAPVTLTPSSNTMSCYPVSWTPEGYSAPITDWFNKYVVTKVTQSDPTGGAAAQTTSYSYVGGAAWHYDDNELVKSKYRTYGQFRGYGDVITYLGDGVNDPQAKTETTYYRGMSKDNDSTVVNVTDSQSGTHEDVNQLAGMTLETTAYMGSDVDNSTIMSYWVSDATATRTRSGLPSLTANWVAPAETFTRQVITSGGTPTWRYTETDTSYDATTSDAMFGEVLHTYTHTVPAVSTYDTCESSTYAAANTGKNIVGLIAEDESDSVACGGFTEGTKPSVPAGLNTLTTPASVSRPAQVISDTRTFYDDTTFSTTFPQSSAPTKGDVTMVRKAVDYSGGSYTWQTTQRAKYDSYGRQTDDYDGNGNDTTTAYTANSVGLTTANSVTNPLGQTVSATLDPQRGSTLTATDANGVVSTEQYDALGRVTSWWLNNRATTTAANYKYTYVISNTGISSTTTQKLNDESGYQKSTLIYDAMLRPRQTQTMTPQGGRLITDTFYDSRGWTAAKYNGWWDSTSLPDTTLVTAADLHDEVPNADVYTYDELGKTVIDQSEKDGVEQSRTTTVDNGDRTTVIPPTGGTITTTITDPLGRTIEQDSYLTPPTVTSPTDPFTGRFTVSGGTDETLTYGFDGHGNQDSTTQGASSGPTWTSTYNLLGQATSTSDPDSGTTTGMAYDGDGNLLQSTDARGKTISYTYDALSRKTGEFDAPTSGQVPGATGNQIAAWIYDNSNNVAGVTHAIGELTTSISYANGAAYTTQQKNFNVFGKSLGVTVTIPSVEGALAGTYTFLHTYSTTTGLPARDVYSAQDGLPSETVGHTYQGALDLPDTLSGSAGYDSGTIYDAYSRVIQQAVGSGTNHADVTNIYDPHTSELTDQLVTRTGGSTTDVDEEEYTYDPSGNITGETDTRLGSGSTSETQCFTYDGLGQLTSAWTANDACATVPTTAYHSMVADSLGSSSAYWTTWTFDSQSDRSQQTVHAFSGGPGSDATTTYTYGTSGGAQPHTVTATATTGAASTSYGYDAAGDMTSRDAAQGNQSLAYDDAGRLTGVTGSTSGDTSFVYDADGNLLIEKDPGASVLYLGAEQITATSAGTSGVRYYDLPGGGQAIRTGSGSSYTYALADQHDTPTLYLDSTAQVPTWRQYTPYGDNRGPAVSAPDNHGFLNKPLDTTTGLTAIGARQYDPVTGRFITDDPELESTDPVQINGYGYAGNNPVSGADPTGKWGFHIHLSSVLKAVATVASVASMIPGPIGMVASGVAAVSYAATGDWKDAAIATAGIALAAAGAGAAAVIATKAAKAAEVGADVVKGAEDADDVVKAANDADQATKTVNDVVGSGDDAEAAVNSAADASDPSASGDNDYFCDEMPESFAPATQVLMADGSTKPIVAVQSGDTVLATDTATGENHAETVVGTSTRTDTDMTDVTVTDVRGHVSTIQTTTQHPFWDDTTKAWVYAGDLVAGHKLHVASGARKDATVTAVRSWTQPETRDDLTVDQLHNFYVIAGDTPILVHNCGRHASPETANTSPDYIGRHRAQGLDPDARVASHAANAAKRAQPWHYRLADAVQKGYEDQENADKLFGPGLNTLPHSVHTTIRIGYGIIRAIGRWLE